MLNVKDSNKQSAMGAMGKPPLMRPSASRASITNGKNNLEETKAAVTTFPTSPFVGPDSDEEFKANEQESKKEPEEVKVESDHGDNNDENEEIESRYSDGVKDDNENIDAGETGTTNDLNTKDSLQEMSVTRVESTADLIMQRAEQIGDFDQFKDKSETEESTIEVPDESIVKSEKDAVNQDSEEDIDAAIDKQVEFTLGPGGFPNAKVENKVE